MDLSGRSLIGAGEASPSDDTFAAVNPTTGAKLEPPFFEASMEVVERAATLAEEAFGSYRKVSASTRADFLRTGADEIEALGDVLTHRAAKETGLPAARIKGETARTTGQLRLFASLVEEGSWCRARIDHPLPDRIPAPKPDIRSMLRPLGPVAVFGAGNFPLAFSVAGGDTASALAAGCPVIARAHESHPGTAELIGRALGRAVKACRMHEGVFSLVQGTRKDIGAALVEHPSICAVGFTGSREGGLALMQKAAARPRPIPVYAEMSSINPVIILPGALAERASAIAQGLAGSVTLGVGQFCTNPGLVFVPRSEDGDRFVEALALALSTSPSGVMLNARIRNAYASGIRTLARHAKVRHLVSVDHPDGEDCKAAANLFEVDAEAFLEDATLAQEVFGPATLLVRYDDPQELTRAVATLEGQLTATVHGSEDEVAGLGELLGLLERKAGRVIFNGFPTGVEVCPSMIHGGPFPSTSDGRTTSVGTHAIERFCRYVAFQDMPDALLPPELQEANPLGLLRLVDGVYLT